MKASFFVPIAVALFSFSSCTKDPDEATCENMSHASIIHNGPVSVGDTAKFAVPEVGGYRIYNWTGPHYFDSHEPGNLIYDVKLENEGWYYVSISNESCDTKVDSFFLDVKLPQGTPACSIPNNNAVYNNLADDNFTNVHKYIESSYSQKILDATGNYANLGIYFHTYWRDFEPEDGIYYTINTPLFEQFDFNYNKVFVTTTKSSIYWASYPGQAVYVSHEGAKLRVRFCNLTMGGTGTGYTTQVSAQVTEQ